MKQTQYLVFYKDSPRAQGLYFGPFVSIEAANRFLDQLPTPLHGGHKGYRVTQPFTSSDIDIVNDLLSVERSKVAA